MCIKTILALTLLFGIFSTYPVRAQLPGQEGFGLPSPVSIDALVALGQRIDDARCGTPQCRGYAIAIRAYIASDQRPGYAGTVYRGPPPTWQSLYRQGNAQVEAVLTKNRALWPEICDAITTVVEHDDFSGPFTTPISVWSLDIGRRITHPGLDCLGEVKKRIPPSEHRDVAMREAYRYCIVEPHAQCGRLKP